MFMLFRRIVGKTPYIGNLISKKYCIGSRVVDCFAANCTCKALADLPVAVVFSQYELAEAHSRFVKHYESLTKEEKCDLQLGHVTARSFMTKRICAPCTDYWLVYLRTNNKFENTYGYLFAKSEITNIVERSKRLAGILKKVSRFQRLIIRLNNKYFGYKFEV